MPINTNDEITGNIDVDDIVQKILADLHVKPEVGRMRRAEVKCVDNVNNKDNINNEISKVVSKIDSKVAKTEVVSGGVESELLLDGGRVISLEDVRRKLDTIQVGKVVSVVIPPSCILTPSAKDELKNRRLEIIVRKIGVNNFPLLLVLHSNVIVSKSLNKQLQSEYELHCNKLTDVSEIVGLVLSNAEQNRRGIILTRFPATVFRATGLCEFLRVIIAIDPKQVLVDAKEINANLMIIPPERISESNIIESIRNFCRTETNDAGVN
jgi:hypothetical protein